MGLREATRERQTLQDRTERWCALGADFPFPPKHTSLGEGRVVAHQPTTANVAPCPPSRAVTQREENKAAILSGRKMACVFPVEARGEEPRRPRGEQQGRGKENDNEVK